ncbi:MAG: flagellar protein FlaG [Spirochaetaceae bacterium]|jgi:flagellar protein FlaG|nr:flagellar protein FlaG [Spirochaetaceae bacterium]
MYIQVPTAGNGIPQTELSQERVPIKAVQTKAVEVKEADAAETVNKSLPRSRNEAPPDIMADLERITVAFNKKLKFEVNHQSDEIIVKVLDPETDKVIKVLPPEELQRLHSKLKETIGFLFDERI